MNTISNVVAALQEREIVRTVGAAHDEARLRYPLQSNTVDTFEEFTDVIGDYGNHHFSYCVSHGGRLSSAEAGGRSKEILERHYRRRNGDIVTAFNDAHDGTNGGMRVILDVIADGMKEEAIERYVRDVFDRFVAPNSWEDKVSIIEQFIARFGDELSSSIRADQPERYAHDYRELIEAYIEGLKQTSSMFRSL